MLGKNILKMLIFFSCMQTKAFAICLFGSHLVQTARMKDLSFSKKKCYLSQDKLPSNLQQIFLKASESKTVKESFAKTDDESFCSHIIRSKKSPQKNFYLLFWFAGENLRGGFIKEKQEGYEKIAQISDGSIEDCTEEFDDYESLAFFYTN